MLWSIEVLRGKYSVTERLDGPDAHRQARASGAEFVTGLPTKEKAEALAAKLQERRPIKS